MLSLIELSVGCWKLVACLNTNNNITKKIVSWLLEKKASCDENYLGFKAFKFKKIEFE